MSEPSLLALRLLGPARIALDDRPIALGSRKAVALLAVLALDGPCSRSRLATLLWPEHDEAGARRNLRREIFRLRNAGVPLDDGEAQSLALAPATACDALVAGARGGILLDGFDHVAGDAYADWLGAWRARLEQRGRNDLTRDAEGHEQRGAWRDALAAWMALIDADPTNETATQQALRMHAKLHDRDAALALFARLESQLRQQLGLAPLPATRELLRAVASVPGRQASPAASPASSPVAAPARPPLPARAPFAGRGGQQAAVQAGWDKGLTVYVSGPPGVGKSRLASECAGGVGAALFVPCRPDDMQLGYSSAVRTLRALFEAAPDLELPAWVTRELTRLLPELGPPAEPGGDPAAPVGDEARMRLFEAYAQAWIELAAGNFNVIVLDDWQFADPASLQLWGFVDARIEALADASAPAPRRLVAFRSGELAETSLAHVRRQVDAGRAVLLELDGLPLLEVQALVQSLAGQTGASLFSQRLHGATGGNPLFVLETIRHLFDCQLLSLDPAGGWRTPFDAVTSDYAELPVPPSARETLLARVHALGADVARLLQAASLAGDSFDFALLAGTAALDESASLAALERAEAGQVLKGGSDGVYRFAHDLYRQCLMENLSPARRGLVHGRLARNLAAAGGAPARIARHFEQAGLQREAAPWFVQAGAEAARVFELETGLLHYERALELGLDAAEAYRVRDRRLVLLHRLHRTEDQLRELTLMAELARGLDNTEAPYELATKRVTTLINSGQVAEAAAHARWVVEGAPTLKLVTRARYLLGVVTMFLGDDAGATRVLEAALADAPTALPDREPMICAFLCHLAVSAGELEVATRHFERGLRSGDALGMPLARSDVLNAGYRMAEAAGDRRLAIARLEEANALSVGVGDVTLRINYLFNLVAVLLNGGEVEAARSRRAEVMALVVDKTDPRSHFIERLSAGRLALFDGDLGKAWRELVGCAAAVGEDGDPNMLCSTLVSQALLLVDCGEAGLLAGVVDRLAAAEPHPAGRIVPLEEALRARIDLLRGDAAAAAARLEAVLVPGVSLSSDPDRRENLELLRVTLSLARAALGDAAGAAAVLQGIGFSPRLKAMAVEATLAFDDAPGRVDAARALLDGDRLSPLEIARLQRALAARHRRCGDLAAATIAADEADRRFAALATTLATDDPASVSLRAALERLKSH